MNKRTKAATLIVVLVLLTGAIFYNASLWEGVARSTEDVPTIDGAQQEEINNLISDVDEWKDSVQSQESVLQNDGITELPNTGPADSE